VRPSGTEPKLKCYIEVRQTVDDDLDTARANATQVCDRLADEVHGW
jgi:phosphomannomutase